MKIKACYAEKNECTRRADLAARYFYTDKKL